MVNPNDDEIFNPYPFTTGIKRPDAKLLSLTEHIASQREILVSNYRTGLDAVSKLLLKAAPLTDLYICLRDHPLENPAKAKVHCEHGFASLRLAVKSYLDKCQHLLGPKVLRRSSSCALYFPFVDLESKFGNHLGTFNKRWPLVTDSLIGSSDSESWAARRQFYKKENQILQLRLSGDFDNSRHPRTKIVHGSGQRGFDLEKGH
ncbi:hypothetical protein BYT27DRAFT_6854424 [Phlegmacium glaucopus]|nr:hypothetical protein BYT27DRAFT_6854424 [Phlegmacium glaucopus]